MPVENRAPTAIAARTTPFKDVKLNYLQAGNEKQSEIEVDQGISWMKSLSDKEAEDYAFLAMLQSFGIQFKGMRAMFISGSIKNYAAYHFDYFQQRAFYLGLVWQWDY